MSNLFSYVKYSEASFPMSNQYTALLIITISIWILLWVGYRNNKINDENKALEKKIKMESKQAQREKLERLYPKEDKK